MGKYYYWEGRNTVDGYNRLSIPFLKKHWYLNNPTWYQSWTVSWTRQGNPNWNIGVSIYIKGDESYVRINFTQTDKASGEKKDFDYRIKLVKTPCHYWGYRWWFICPCKWNRCSILYLQSNWYFASRKTLNLCYEDQKVSKKWREFIQIYPKDEEAYELRKTIKYTHRNGKATRKYKRYLRISKAHISDSELYKLEQKFLLEK